MVKKKIFISYSREDEEYVTCLHEVLCESGFDCFLDSKDIKVGEVFVEEIKQKLLGSSHFIVFISDNSLGSNWVSFEHGIAVGSGIPCLPVIIRDKLTKALPSFLDTEQNIEISDCKAPLPEKVKEGVINFLIRDGIVPRKLLENSKKRLYGEVFAAELLTRDILLSKNKYEEIEVIINRNNVGFGVISKAGKDRLCEEFVKDKEEELKELDLKIHRFLLRESGESSIVIPLREKNLPLRWASGGVLSIVTYKGKEWAPFFFRDIKPIGWNISLGSSERYFDKDWNVIGELNKELNDPRNYIRREFLEETLVLNNDPGETRNLRFKKFLFEDSPLVGGMKPVDQFSEEHIILRQNCDLLNISKSGDCCIEVNSQNPKTKLRIVNRGEERLSGWNILICFNLLELGIEVVKVIKYRLEDNDYILDGEILVNEDGEKELVRMPVALISMDYLEKTFKNRDLKFTRGTQPSVEGGEIPPGDIHIFNWDVKKRWEDRENVRHNQWKDKFAKYFIDGNGEPVKSGFNKLFTPASAKILSYYFANQ